MDDSAPVTDTPSNDHKAMPAENEEALKLWHRVLVETVRQDMDLTARQMALMLHVHTGTGPHSVASLADQMNISKPAVCRALDRLSIEDFVRRVKDPYDRRKVTVEITEAGHAYLWRFSESVLNNLMALG